MADSLTRRERSGVMSRVRARGNRSTELALVRLMRAARIVGWRRHLPITGTPDFCFPSLRLAVFVDGCFWHSCPIHGALPADNRGYWRLKLARNRKRDHRVSLELRARGWIVVRIWEHELRGTPAVPWRLRGAILRAKDSESAR